MRMHVCLKLVVLTHDGNGSSTISSANEVGLELRVEGSEHRKPRLGTI